MGGLKSQRVGKSWEQEIIDAYYKKGYQPFKIPTEIMGTCFDIITIKNATVICIEAKHITGDKLYFKSCGLQKKQDEINHFIKHCNTMIIKCLELFWSSVYQLNFVLYKFFIYFFNRSFS